MQRDVFSLAQYGSYQNQLEGQMTNGDPFFDEPHLLHVVDAVEQNPAEFL